MPEIKPVNSTTHFKCAFNISDSGDHEEPLMTRLRKIIRSWCKEKVDYTNEGPGTRIYEPWFFNGNHPTSPCEYIAGNQIRVAIVPGENISDPPAWMLELIHRDSGETARRWSAEIGLRRLADGNVRFTTVISHWMIPNYIGEYPQLPYRSVPKYVARILKEDGFNCKRGDTIISHQFQPVTHENAQAVYDELKNPARQQPFVFVGARPGTDQLALDPVAIYRSLLGNANVFAFFEESALEEMNYYLGSSYRCDLGAIRCYLPHFDKTRSDNSSIHRYFGPQKIESVGQDYVIECVANGLARNGSVFTTRDLRSFSDLFALRRKIRLDNILQNRDSTDDQSEELKLFMDECEELSLQKDEFETLANQYSQENDRLKTELGNTRYQVKEAERLRGQFKKNEQVQNAVNSLDKLPQSLSDVLQLAGALFPQRLAISGDAFKTAAEHEKNFDYWKKPEGLSIAWAMLFDLAQKGHELLLNEKGGDIERMFNDGSNFELAMTEGKTTKQNAKLMEKREFVHEGKNFQMAPHLKFGNKNPKMLRLHFAVDNDQDQLVVGHFGDHMTNASSRKKS